MKPGDKVKITKCRQEYWNGRTGTLHEIIGEAIKVAHCYVDGYEKGAKLVMFYPDELEVVTDERH